jgi:hypothetical protein
MTQNEPYTKYMEKEMQEEPVAKPVILFIVLTTIAVLIMLPTAGALYYSKCLNVSLLMGFGIFFSSLLISLFSLLLPEVIRGNVVKTSAFAYGLVVIYTVFTQIIGGCNF